MIRLLRGRLLPLVCSLLIVFTLAACGGGSNSGSTTGGNGTGSENNGNGSNPTEPSSSPEHLYWANPNSGNIVVYSIDPSSGALTMTTTVQTHLSTLFAISSDPHGKYLYATGPQPNSSEVSTIGYSIDKSSGNLTQIAGSPFSFNVFFVNQVNTGINLYGADNITNQIHTISIDTATGALTHLVASTSSGGNNPYSPRLNSDGTLLAVANQSSNNLSVFTIDSATGVLKLAPGAPFPANTSSSASCPPKGGCGSDVALVNTDLYYGSAALAQSDSNGSAIYAYTISSNGSLAPLAGSPFSNPRFAPQTLAATPNHKFLYVANAGGGVVGYSVNSNGTLTLIPGAEQNGSGYVVVDPQSKFLYVGDNTYTNGILGYSIDQTTGALTPISGTPVGSGAQGGQIVIR